MKDENILITGGLGFIGSHIVNELIENNNVTIIDNMSTGKISNLNSNPHKNLTIIKKDLRNSNLNDNLKDIDYVFHLAAMVSVPLSIKNPVRCNEYNVSSTVDLLSACVKNDVNKIIFSSSSAIYGENVNLPLKETEKPMPASPYAASKANCELYLKAFYESYNLNYVALRYFNVFGPKQDKNSPYAAVIPNFINAILKGERPIIYGDGNQTRDFIYVKDVAKANINSCKSKFNGEINIASGKCMSINKLFEIIRRLLNSDTEVKYLPPREGDIKYSYADISNMKKINFQIVDDNFENQLKETVMWFKNELEKKF